MIEMKPTMKSLSIADSIAVLQYLEKNIGRRGREAFKDLLTEFGDVVCISIEDLTKRLLPFESLYPGIVAEVFNYILTLRDKDPITEKLNDPAFVEAERNRFRETVIRKEEPATGTSDFNSIDELYESLTTFFTKMAKSVPSGADGL